MKTLSLEIEMDILRCINFESTSVQRDVPIAFLEHTQIVCYRIRQIS